MAISRLNHKRIVGYVYVGNGTTVNSRYFGGTFNYKQALRTRNANIAARAYTGPIITVLSDGTMASNAADASSIATAKTYLAGLSKRQLTTMNNPYDTRVRIQAALP